MPKDSFKITITKPLTLDQNDPLFIFKQSASFLLDPQEIERSKKQFLRELYGNVVEIDKKHYNEGKAIGQNNDALKINLETAFKLKPEAYPLHQGVIAGTLNFINQMYSLKNEKNMLLHISPNSVLKTLKRHQDTYSLEARIDCYCIKTEKHIFLMEGTSLIKLDSNQFWETIKEDEPLEDAIERLKGGQLLLINIQATIDCTDPKNTQATLFLEVNSDVQSLMYNGPIKDSLVSINIESLVDDEFELVSPQETNDELSEGEEDKEANELLSQPFNQLIISDTEFKEEKSKKHKFF